MTVSLIDSLIFWLFSWPGILLSLLLSAIGIIRKNPVLCILGAIFAVPFSFYLGASPAIGPAAFLLPTFQLGAGLVVNRRGPIWLAWLLLLPFAATAAVIFVFI